MPEQDYKYVFGPVYSWRLGVSLGIDPISSDEKVCSFNCIYCQLGETIVLQAERKIFVPTQDIINEIKALELPNVDYYTFSGTGEPTLAANLGELIRAVKEQKKGKVAVITNSTLIDREDVQADLLLSDFVLAKLDCCDEESLNTVNQPLENIRFLQILEGIKSFKEKYKGRLALQIMFVAQNKHVAGQIADIAKEIGPDEVQINTPLRPSGVDPLSKEELDAIKVNFSGLPVVSVYDQERKDMKPMDLGQTSKRHGEFYPE